MTSEMTKKKIRLQVREADEGDLQHIFFSWNSNYSDDSALENKQIITALEGRYREIFKSKFDQVDGTYKIWVAQMDGELVAWQYLMPFENNPVARNFSAEIGIYVNPDYQNEGIGTALVRYAQEHAKRTLLQYICGICDKNNDALLKIATKLGFKVTGEFPPPIKSPETNGSYFLTYLVPSG